MPRGISRRQLMMKVLAAGTLLPALNLLPQTSQGADLKPLDSKDSAASALGFVAQSATASANPLYKKGQHCASCLHFLGKQADATGGCDIYAGRSVPADGWCSAWSQRPG
jgi:High potential iron-sulfur protein